MGLIRFTHGEYEEENPIQAITNFSEKIEKTEGFYGAVMTSSNPYIAIKQMQLVQKYFDYEEKGLFIHFLISSERFNELPREILYRIGKQFGKFFSKTNQSFFAIHEPSNKDKNVHIEMVLNPISYVDGKETKLNQVAYGDFEKYVEMVIDEELLTCIDVYYEKEEEKWSWRND